MNIAVTGGTSIVSFGFVIYIFYQFLKLLKASSPEGRATPHTGLTFVRTQL